LAQSEPRDSEGREIPDNEGSKKRRPLIGLLQIFGVILIVVIAMIYSREPTVVDVAEPALGSLA
jgi:hypothetical protein